MLPPAVPTTALAVTSPAASLYVGEVVYIYAFDIAYEFLRQPFKSLLGQPVAQFAVDGFQAQPAPDILPPRSDGAFAASVAVWTFWAYAH